MLKNLASMSSLNLFKAGVQFAISTLVALFVLPAEYGLVTFSLPIIQFIALMTDMGLGSAIIRQRDLRPEDAGAAPSAFDGGPGSCRSVWSGNGRRSVGVNMPDVFAR